METNGGTHFSTGNNKEAYGGNSDENEKGGKEEVKEETGGISPEGGKIQTGASPKEEGNQEVGASPEEEGKEEVKEETVVSPARWWVLTILFSHYTYKVGSCHLLTPGDGSVHALEHLGTSKDPPLLNLI